MSTIEQWPKKADVGTVAGVEVRIYHDSALLSLNFATSLDRDGGEISLTAHELRQVAQVMLWAAFRLDQR